jgi:hypothetical protein
MVRDHGRFYSLTQHCIAHHDTNVPLDLMVSTGLILLEVNIRKERVYLLKYKL